jgi:hypothetical protein
MCQVHLNAFREAELPQHYPATTNSVLREIASLISATKETAAKDEKIDPPT